MRLDDTEGQISVQVASEHAHSQLNLGYLATPRRDGKAEPRGEGLEMCTDAAGAIRAAHGLLLTTDARPGATGKQLDRQELSACLDEARALVQTLASIAQQAQADAADPKPQQQLEAAIDHLDGGTSVNLEGGGGQQPVIGISGAAGIAISTPKTTAMYAGENIDLVSNRDLQHSVNRRWVANIGGAMSWFAAGQGMPPGQINSVSLIAGRGNLLAQAQTGTMTLQAQQDILIGTNARVRVDAQGGITLTAGGAQFDISDGNVTVKCLKFTVQAAAFSFDSPASASARAIAMPGTQELKAFNEAFVVKHEETGAPLPHVRYRVEDDEGTVVAQGVTDEHGRTVRVHTDAARELRLFLLDN